MKIVQQTVPVDITNIKEFLDLLAQSAFIDIETTGLGHFHKLVIVGMVRLLPNYKAEVTQFFNDDGKSERELLQALIDYLKKTGVNILLSYNGDAFDLPFLNARLVKHHFSFTLNKQLNIDILKIARQNKALFGNAKLNLKHIESYLGIARTDTISGKESVELYRHYLTLKLAAHPIIEELEALEYVILHHNFDDLVNMLPLTALLKFGKNIPFTSDLHHQIMAHHAIWYLTVIDLTGSNLVLQFDTHGFELTPDIEKNDLGIRFAKTGFRLSITADIVTLDGPQGKLIMLNTLRIFNKDIMMLSDNEKYQYVLKVEDQWLTEHLTSFIQYCFDTYAR
jgi:uncharacterized protein YprB with RNaseH-like and TPR domain